MSRTKGTTSNGFRRGPGHPTIAIRALVLPLAVVFALLGATSALAISRNSTLARAQSWVDKPVPYSQSAHHLGYRTDCSGYVSMCWATKTSWNTRSFYKVSHRISVAQLQPGDAMLKKGYHIRLFYGWVDDTHASYVAYEANTIVAVCRIHSTADDLAFGYIPTRYDHISASPKPRNVLRNGTFDVWAQSWSGDGQPVWWTVDGPSSQMLATHRRDVYHSARNSLRLLNPNSDPGTYTELSQTASVTAGVRYRLSAWAKTASNPASITLSITCLDATGNPLSETTTTAGRWGINGASFKVMSVTATTPPNTIKALVTVRLPGGTTPTGTVGAGVTGTSVTLDDISLVRPQVSVSIRTSTSTAHSGTTVGLSGLVTPVGALGKPCLTYVRRPGSGWTQLSSARVIASGTAAAWHGKFTFTPSMSRGVYWFKTAVPGFPGYLGSTSRAASVTLK